MSRRQRGSKSPKKPVQILSEALDSVVSPVSESHFAASSSLSASPKPKKVKHQKYNPSAITSYEELISAIDAGEPHLTLGDNIIASDNILIKQNLIIDFNGYSLIAEDDLPSARLLDIRSGEVTLAGKGKIFAMGPNGVALRAFGAISSGLPEYTVVHVGPDIQLFAPNAYGILVSPNLGVAYGLTINFAGRIFARDGICIASGVNGRDLHLPTINIKSNAAIIADEASGSAVEAIGYGIWNIASARLSGAVAANLKAGQLDFTGSQLIANAGPAFNLIENSAKDLTVNLVGGNYVSMSSDLIAGSPTSVKKFQMKTPTFYGLQNIVAPELKATINPKKAQLHADVSDFLESLLLEPTTLSEPTPIAAEEPDSIAPEIFSIDELAPSEPSAIAAELNTPETPATTPELTQFVELPTDDTNPLIEDSLLDAFAEAPVTVSILSEDTSESPELLAAFAEDPSTELKVSHSKKSSLTSTPEPTPEDLPVTSSVTDSAETLPTPEPATTESPSLSSASAPSITSVAPTAVITSSASPIPPAHSTPRAVILSSASVSSPAASPTTTISSTISSAAISSQTNLPTFEAPARPALLSEQEAARQALTDAIAEIRKLKPEDYEAGFADLERALRKAEHILASPLADLADIRDASSMLLQAFDSLEERDEFSLSDEELDELFYHGAVLEEVARPEKPSKKSAKSATKPPKAAPVILEPLVSAKPAEQTLPEPDFSVLSEIISTIAGLKLDNYTPESQESLLDELDRAEIVLANMSSSQSEIDEVATSLLAEMSKLERARFSHAPAISSVKTNAPAPVIGAALPSTMIDELAPATYWTLGTTMIDEMTPYLMDVSTREQIVRAMRPWINEIVDMATEPFKKLSRSIAAGIRAGRHAYHESLHSGARF